MYIYTYLPHTLQDILHRNTLYIYIYTYLPHTLQDMLHRKQRSFQTEQTKERERERERESQFWFLQNR